MRVESYLGLQSWHSSPLNVLYVDCNDAKGVANVLSFCSLSQPKMISWQSCVRRGVQQGSHQATQLHSNLQSPLRFQANPELESSVYSKKRVTLPGCFLLETKPHSTIVQITTATWLGFQLTRGLRGRVGIRGVAEAVTDKVQGNYGDEDEGRREQEPWSQGHGLEVLSFDQENAPAYRGLAHT